MRWLIAGVHSLDSVIRVTTWYLARHLATRSAKADAGHRVLYLPAPISPLHFALGRRDPRFVERRSSYGDRPRVKEHGILEYTPLTLLPAVNRFPFATTPGLRRSLEFTVPRLRSVLRRAGFDRPDVLAVSNLQYAYLGPLVSPRLLVYRAEDDIRGFSNAAPSLVRAELDLIERCDLCFATSENLASKLRSRGARDVRVIRNGVDCERFFSPAPEGDAADLAAIPHPRVVYVGALSAWFNDEWVRHAAERLPDRHFVLIGPRDAPLTSLRGHPNVHLLGSRPADRIPAYLQACDVAVIPFRRSPLIESVCPLKLYEYLAAGIPVVAARWNELERIAAPCDLVDDAEGFARAIESAPNRRPADELRAFARRNDWNTRFSEFERTVLETSTGE
ncbi:glycosyltransferase [Candidatus Sumerlaeota bacterium]|nr:glycosyltransferase [Candidatus Sumerlaeota bacterium]